MKSWEVSFASGEYLFQDLQSDNRHIERDHEMIHMSLKMDFTPGKVEEALQILRSIVEPTRAEVGCIDCSVYKDMAHENQILFIQKWRSEEFLQRHLRSEEYQKVLLVMEMAVAPPEIVFETIASTSGVETIEKARESRTENWNENPDDSDGGKS
jgi:quinol monooxygenase YgiN